jgi:hypothetical protein
MLKYLAILALAFNALPVHAYAQTDKTQQASKSHNPSPTLAPIAVAQNPNSPDLQPKHQEHVDAEVRVVSTPEKDSWDKAAVWVNMGLGIIGVCGIVVAVITLRKVERQTVATEKSVTHSMLNIQAFVNSERPWIKVDFCPKVEGRDLGIVIRAINCGRTPAALVSKNKSFCSIDLCRGSLPAKPSYNADPFEYPKIVYPGDSCELFWISSVKDATGFSQNAEHKSWNDLDIETYMFGNVVYKDVLTGKDAPEYETRWCYTVMPLNEPEKFLLVEHQTTEEYNYRT